MKYESARPGRMYIIRLDDGDVVHEAIEAMAKEEGLERAFVLLLGGADDGSTVVVGPEDGRSDPIVPMERLLAGVHEMAGVGTIFPNEAGEPVLHLHAAFGRGEAVTAGCIRRGVTTWIIGEVVVVELTDCKAGRRVDPATGFELLEL